MRRLIWYVFLFLFVFECLGCSAVMALKQPEKKNLDVLSPGISRENVINHLGAPVSSDTKEGKRTDIYQFVQGYSGGTKASRATVHVIGDLFTLFLWEFIGMPTELIANGNKMSIKINFDAEDRLVDFIYLGQPA